MTARLSPAILGALAATSGAVALLVPGWAVACGLGAIALGVGFVADLWHARRRQLGLRRWLGSLRPQASHVRLVRRPALYDWARDRGAS